MSVRVGLAGTFAAVALSLAPAQGGAQTARPDAGASVAAPVTEEPRALIGGPIPYVERSPEHPLDRPQSVPFSVPTPIAAGWRDDLFFLSDPSHDWFISPGARLQVDFHAFTPHGVADDRLTGMGTAPSGLRTGFQVRRARIELAGGMLSFLTWRLGAELTDNGPQTAADLLVNLRVHRLFNIQLGQFDAPFTMENRTSDRYLDFLERSLTVRGLGIPTGKEIGVMFWGEDVRRVGYWSVGAFNGGGPNRFTPQNQIEGIARVFFHPFMRSHTRAIGRNFQLGASGRVGNRGLTGQSAYPEMTTPAGYSLFRPALPSASTLVSRGLQWGVAAEFDLPLHRFDLRGEFVYVRNATGEAPAGPNGQPAAHPGTLEGFGFYTQIGYWFIGLPATSLRVERNDTMALPGYQDPPSMRADRPQMLTLPFGLQVVARFDTIQFAYRGDGIDARANGQYRVLAAEFGANLWLTRHVRFLVGYRHYWFPDQPGETATDVNLMQGPTGHPGGYGEFSTRAAVSL